jgi:hypothetical protein
MTEGNNDIKTGNREGTDWTMNDGTSLMMAGRGEEMWRLSTRRRKSARNPLSRKITRGRRFNYDV